MADYTQTQLRVVGEAGLVGDVAPKTETRSDDAKASVAAIAALQVAAQAKINAKRTPGIGVAP
jgi:hypothetical protein